MSKGKMVAFMTTFGIAFLTGASAFAQGDAAANTYSMYSMFALAAGLAIGIAASGAALGQGRAAAAALEGIARNPGAADKLTTPLVLSLAFMEALGIFAFVIAFIVSGNIDMTAIGG